MLKIKDNVDLKELEKFGFKYSEVIDGTYTYHIPSSYGQKKDLHINKYGYMSMELYTNVYGMNIPNIIYDLIKADLVEKVDEDGNN